MSFNTTIVHIEECLNPHSERNRGIPITRVVKVDTKHLRDLMEDWKRLDIEIRKLHARNRELAAQINDMHIANQNRDPDIVGIA